ncbi:lysophospholipid acyltransferase family protein [Georgenia muralis]
MARSASRGYRLTAALILPVMRASTRRSWRGGEHLPTTGFIAVSNHVSNFDPLTLAHFLYDHGAPPRFLAKDSLFEIPLLGRVIRALGQIPVERGTAQAGHSLTAAEGALAAGECVVIFPEGTHTRDPHLWPMVGRTGAARLALRTGAPVVPIAQWGAHRVVPRYSASFRPFPPKEVTVVAAPPVDLSDLSADDGDAIRVASARIMAAVTDQLAEIRGEAPPARPYDMRLDGDPRASFDAARAARRAARRARRARRQALRQRVLGRTPLAPAVAAGRSRVKTDRVTADDEGTAHVRPHVQGQ